MKLLCSLPLVFLTLNASILNAQDSTVVRDFEVWSGLTFEKSFLENKLDIGLTQEFRFNDNSSQLNVFFTELESKYTFKNNIVLGGAYRFIRNDNKDGYVSQHRINLDLGYKYELDRLTFGARARYQSRISSDEDEYSVTKYRFRLKAEYNIKNWKLDPYVSAEVFHRSEDYLINYIPEITEAVLRSSGFEKMRYTVGTSYKISDHFKLGAFYRIEKEFKSYPLFYNTPATYFIGGLNLTIKL